MTLYIKKKKSKKAKIAIYFFYKLISKIKFKLKL